VTELSDKTLFPQTKVSTPHGLYMIWKLTNGNQQSWYMGDNIPGKVREQLNFAGGFPLYKELTQGALDRGFEGFITA
jgi:hypothetical protein